jgi:hypothetical protein
MEYMPLYFMPGFSLIFPPVVQKVDQWATTRSVSQTFPLPTLKDAVIGVDASYYLDLKLNANPKEEPLKHALGGVPFCLKAQITDDIECLADAGIKVVFVFSGLQHVNGPNPEYLSQDSVRAAETAWQKYRAKEAESCNAEFSKAKYPTEFVYRWLQDLLAKFKIEFIVAPYSAVAQLAYMVKLSEQYIDCIWGSTDHFLFGVDKVISNVSVAREVKDAHFTWLSKAACEERLKVTPDAFRDAQLLLGTSFSPIFPPLERQGLTPKGTTIQDAVSMLNSQNRSVLQLCHVYRDDPLMVDSQYTDTYKKAIMSLRHHIAMETSGSVAIMNFDFAPGNVHEYVGQNLPQELFFYMSRGIIGPELPNWLTHDHIDLVVAPGVVETASYRQLVYEQLNPLRAQSLKLISDNLNNYYRYRTVKIHGWDDQPRDDLTIQLRNEASLKDKIVSWKVKDDLLASFGSEVTLLTCLQAIKDDSFRQKTLNSGKIPHQHPAFKSTNEVVANTFYRFLRVRGYVDDEHALTNWGRVLETTLSKLGPMSKAEDTAVLTVELMRFGLLDGSEADGSSAPQVGKWKIDQHCM